MFATVAVSRSNRIVSVRRSAHPRAGIAPIVGDGALAARGDPSDTATARIVDCRLIAARRLAADHLAPGIVALHSFLCRAMDCLAGARDDGCPHLRKDIFNGYGYRYGQQEKTGEATPWSTNN